MDGGVPFGWLGWSFGRAHPEDQEEVNLFENETWIKKNISNGFHLDVNSGEYWINNCK